MSDADPELHSSGLEAPSERGEIPAGVGESLEREVTEPQQRGRDTQPRSAESTIAESDLSLIAVIPAYNEADTLEEVVIETKQYVDRVVVVDDASTDQTEEIARQCADGVITHPRNMGVGGSLHTGYLAALREDFDVVIQIDADGQHDPAYIPEFVREIRESDADMVIGSRWLNESYREYSLTRRAGIQFFTEEANLLTDLDITDVTSGYRAYRTEMLADLGRPENPHWALGQTIEAARKGYDIEEISVPMPPETEGSQFDLSTLLKYPPRMILSTLKVVLYR